eukprot:CAMPEP_0182430664 /NCGR_PEP_ID=MMETSP1167-20130531/42409_1 /TAXON_ID=2988 /ORGANISM="Mallomonas Sp, Strain CCMP3275" /LENGTH=261 /DNA_ID=CAMNT_0024616019 /DNA_START=55 /DNA_END=840 /DNA_ORIENTATION=+
MASITFLSIIVALSLAALDSFSQNSYLLSSTTRKRSRSNVQGIDSIHNVCPTSLAVGTQAHVYPKEQISSPIVTIREALLHELIYVVALRVDVFYPELRLVTSFHRRILEKLRQRAEQGAVCLIAVMDEQVVPRLKMHMSSMSSKLSVIGTVEVSPTDFRNTSMEAIGHQRKLYAMDLAVSSEVRRMGIATHLLDAAETYALKNEYQEIYLHVEVDNEPARTLYQKNGYIEVPETEWALAFTKHRLHKPPESYVLMWKEIF